MSRRPLAYALALSINAALAALGGDALAQSDADRAQARELGEKGYAALEAKDFAKAADLFGRADALYHAPTLLLGLARAEVQLGKYVEAWEHYHRIVLEGAPANAPQAIRDAVQAAKQEMAGVETHRARLTLTVKGPSHPATTLDGVSIPPAALGAQRLVNPGAHVVHVSAAGYKDQDKRFDIADGGEATLAIDLEPAGASAAAVAPGGAGAAGAADNAGNAANAPGAVPPGAPPVDRVTTDSRGGVPRKTLGWIGIGVGGAGLVTGIVTGVLAMGSRSSAAGSPCANGPCASSDLASYQSDRDSFHSMATISTIAFVAGGVLAAGGAVLLLTAPKDDHPPASAWARPYLSPTGGGVVGAF